MLMDLHPSLQHQGFLHAVWQLQQEVTRSKARFEPSLPQNYGVDGEESDEATGTGYSPWWSSLPIITSIHCISGICTASCPVSPRTAGAKMYCCSRKWIKFDNYCLFPRQEFRELCHQIVCRVLHLKLKELPNRMILKINRKANIIFDN